jgi:hypothetical protein
MLLTNVRAAAAKIWIRRGGMLEHAWHMHVTQE